MLRALLVSTGTLWVGTARFPRALAKAGFNVALLTPRGALAEKSRFVHTLAYLPDNATATQWVYAFAAAAEATEPALVLPCDDMSFRLLATLHADRPPAMAPALHRKLAALISGSLGEPRHYMTSVDKLLLPPAAQALGVRVPPFMTIDNDAAAAPFIARHGYPVVVKRSFSTAGEGVIVCADQDELATACKTLLAAPSDFGAGRPDRLLLQAAIDGTRMFHPTLAWHGELRVGWAAEVLIALSAKGTSAVSRQFHHPALREAAARLARGLGMHGIFGIEFIVERNSGLPYVLEINRRVSPGFHRGADFDVDLAAGLWASLHGRPSTSRSHHDEREVHFCVNFPQEWLRDPDSTNLREHPVDVPWDDPDLIEAFLAMRHNMK